MPHSTPPLAPASLPTTSAESRLEEELAAIRAACQAANFAEPESEILDLPKFIRDMARDRDAYYDQLHLALSKSATVRTHRHDEAKPS